MRNSIVRRACGPTRCALVAAVPEDDGLVQVHCGKGAWAPRFGNCCRQAAA